MKSRARGCFVCLTLLGDIGTVTKYNLVPITYFNGLHGQFSLPKCALGECEEGGNL